MKISAKQIIDLGKQNPQSLTQEMVDSYLSRIETAYRETSNDELLLQKVELSLLEEVSREQIESWISQMSAGIKEEEDDDAPKNEILVLLAHHLEKTDLKRAFEVAAMTVDAKSVFEDLCKKVDTEEQFALAETFIDQIEDPKNRTKTWITIASHLSPSHPDLIKPHLSKLVELVEQMPDGKDLDWKPGTGKRNDAYISYLPEKTRLMGSVIKIHLHCGECDRAQELGQHTLRKEPKAQLGDTLSIASYFSGKNPETAEKYYEDAVKMISQVNAYDWSHNDIKKQIARSLLAINPNRALEIVKSLHDKFERNLLLKEFIQETVKENPEFARDCLKQMSQEPSYLRDKAEAYLDFVEASKT